MLFAEIGVLVVVLLQTGTKMLKEWIIQVQEDAGTRRCNSQAKETNHKHSATVRITKFWIS
jgi:hypothetical protein